MGAGCSFLYSMLSHLSMSVQNLERWSGPLTAVGCERFQDHTKLTLCPLKSLWMEKWLLQHHRKWAWLELSAPGLMINLGVWLNIVGIRSRCSLTERNWEGPWIMQWLTRFVWLFSWSPLHPQVVQLSAHEAAEGAQVGASAIHQTEIWISTTFKCLSIFVPWSQFIIDERAPACDRRSCPISKHWVELAALCHSFHSCESPPKKGKPEVFFCWGWGLGVLWGAQGQLSALPCAVNLLALWHCALIKWKSYDSEPLDHHTVGKAVLQWMQCEGWGIINVNGEAFCYSLSLGYEL